MLVRIAWMVVFVVATQGLGHADDATAKRHYEAGAKAYNLQRFADALTEFRAAYEERADPAFLFNIAQAQRQLGEYEAAARSYRAYLHEQPEAPNRDDVAKLIADMDDAARKQRPAAATTPPAAAVSHPPPMVEYRDEGRRKRVGGAITGGLGVAAIALGATFAVLSKEAGDAAYHPSNGVYDPQADARQKSYRTGDIVCFALGGAMVVAGTTVWLIGHHQRHERVRADAGGAP